MNSDLSILNDWFKAKQLSVNPSKTKYILFGKYASEDCSGHYLHIENEKLDRVKSTKFLGLYIDENFTWDVHVNYCKKKFNSTWYISCICDQYFQEFSFVETYTNFIL